MESIETFFAENDLGPLVIEWGIRLGMAVLIFVIGRIVIALMLRGLRRVLNRRELDENLKAFLLSIAYALLLTVLVLAVLDQLGVPITSFIAIVGAAGLAIGLALKDSLGNFAAGTMLIIFRPFTRGDFVEVNDITGKVDEVNIFNTVLTTTDNKLVIIPNGLVFGSAITNYTAKDTRRVDLTIGVGYDDDLQVAKETLMGILQEHPLVLKDPEPVVTIMNLGDSSVDFVVRPWVKTDDYWAVYSDVLGQAKVKLEAAGCSIPYPQRDVHVFNENGADGPAAG